MATTEIRSGSNDARTSFDELAGFSLALSDAGLVEVEAKCLAPHLCKLPFKFGDALLNPISEDGGKTSPEIALRDFCTFVRLVQQCEMDIPPPPGLVRALFTFRLPRGRSLGRRRAAWRLVVELPADA